jgi:hypothetical protein
MSTRRSVLRTVSQNSTAYVVRNTEVDVIPGELEIWTAEAINSSNSLPR